MTDQLLKTKYTTDELNEAITEQGIVKAFEQYKNNAEKLLPFRRADS